MDRLTSDQHRSLLQQADLHTTKGTDVLLDPVQSQTLISQAHVGATFSCKLA